MRDLFEQWGRPQRIRVDNGTPWATWADLPTAMALWWIGLDIEPIWNPPRSPKENPFVERCNGLLDAWGEPERCADLASWKQKLAWVARTQREVYPSIQGRPRLEAFPQLAEPARPYRAAAEEELFDLERVTRYLEQGRWPRLVSKIGQITLYGKPYHVGRAFTGQYLWVRLDAATHEWVVEDEAGTAVIRHPAAQITAERIRALKVAHPRPPSRKTKRQNLAANRSPQPYSA